MVMGGMWSLYVLTEVMIFMVVVRSVEAVARRTLARSVGGAWLAEIQITNLEAEESVSALKR